MLSREPNNMDSVDRGICMDDARPLVHEICDGYIGRQHAVRPGLRLVDLLPTDRAEGGVYDRGGGPLSVFAHRGGMGGGMNGV